MSLTHAKLSHTIHAALGRTNIGISHLCRCRNSDVLSAALTNRTVEIYSLRETRGVHLCHLGNIQGAVTDQLFRFESNRYWLMTCTDEGYLQQWDIRSGESIDRSAATVTLKSTELNGVVGFIIEQVSPVWLFANTCWQWGQRRARLVS